MRTLKYLAGVAGALFLGWGAANFFSAKEADGLPTYRNGNIVAQLSGKTVYISAVNVPGYSVEEIFPEISSEKDDVRECLELSQNTELDVSRAEELKKFTEGNYTGTVFVVDDLLKEGVEEIQITAGAMIATGTFSKENAEKSGRTDAYKRREDACRKVIPDTKTLKFDQREKFLFSKNDVIDPSKNKPVKTLSSGGVLVQDDGDFVYINASDWKPGKTEWEDYLVMKDHEEYVVVWRLVHEGDREQVRIGPRSRSRGQLDKNSLDILDERVGKAESILGQARLHEIREGKIESPEKFQQDMHFQKMEAAYQKR